MMTSDQNKLLTQVGPGTPMGEVLRRYWWPVGISDHLKDKPTFIRVLGEDLVLFRDRSGRSGVLEAHCSHRGVNLCFGTVQDHGLRCRYHGWVYDIDGNVVEIPGAPDTTLQQSVKHRAYPAQDLGGLIFTYMGPQPAPLLPRFHFLVADGDHFGAISGVLNNNWLQGVENGMDPFHSTFLHGDVWSAAAKEAVKTWFEETEWGVVYKTIRPGRKTGEYNYREHHCIMPGVSVGGDRAVSSGLDRVEAHGFTATSARWSVPIDDTHSLHLRSHFIPADLDTSGRPMTRESSAGSRKAPYEIQPYREYLEQGYENPTLGYTMPRAIGQEDVLMLDSMDPIVRRENENLGVGDEGLRMLRQIYLDSIAHAHCSHRGVNLCFGTVDERDVRREPEVALCNPTLPRVP